MSLTDKVIKNTYYYFLSQIINYVIPLFLTPFIISYIGITEFGIYALVIGLTGTFGLFDMSISTSYIKFISEHYQKKDYSELNRVINSGTFFYILFGSACVLIGFIFTRKILSLVNIPAELFDKSVTAFRIGLFIFFIPTSLGIFNSVLISLQKMYLTSISGVILSVLNLIVIIIILVSGFGLLGILYTQLVFITLSIIISYLIAKKILPEIHLSLKYFSRKTLGKLSNFGFQMQVSKLASYASDKYDEFLLGYFSIMNNVAFFNISNRISRVARSVPFQLVPQVAPIAAELNVGNNQEKIKMLFEDTSKYLLLVSLPIFLFLIFFADVIMLAWMGSGYEISAMILRILAIGQLVNMIFSAPGNSITPNIGIPKYQMREGLIHFSVNLIVSFLCIKYLGIIGSAYGNSIALTVASLYVFYVSCRHFNINKKNILSFIYIKPFFIGLGNIIILYFIYKLTDFYFINNYSRETSIPYLIILLLIYFLSFVVFIFQSNYLKERDINVFFRIINRILPLRRMIEKSNSQQLVIFREMNVYSNELVSIFIVTYNRYELFKQCYENLLRSLVNINYELIIWDNGSTDKTVDFLKSIEEGVRVRVIFHHENIGTNAKGKAAELCNGEFIIGIDDDVIEFPQEWVDKMVRAYRSVPKLGYLAANVIQDDKTNGAKPSNENYTMIKYNNDTVNILFGPTGGWCFIISKEIYKKIGKFSDMKDRIFFSEDGEYINRLVNKGYRYGILEDVKVYHATGEYYNKKYKQVYDMKMKDYFDKMYDKKYERKIRIKKMFSFKRHFYKYLEYAEKQLFGEKPAE